MRTKPRSQFFLLGALAPLAFVMSQAPTTAGAQPLNTPKAAPATATASATPTAPATPDVPQQLPPAPRTKMVGKGKVDLYQPSAPASGMWTSRAPAKNGAYRYPLLIIGVVVLLITIGLLIYGLRRVERARQP